MNEKEKLLLLQLILEDIRGNWAFDLERRYEMALDLSKELKLENFINSITEYIENCDNGDNDGRFFRMSYKEGGYINLEELHGLENTILDKSDDFKAMVYVLTYPENRFKDWYKFSN